MVSRNAETCLSMGTGSAFKRIKKNPELYKKFPQKWSKILPKWSQKGSQNDPGLHPENMPPQRGQKSPKRAQNMTSKRSLKSEKNVLGALFISSKRFVWWVRSVEGPEKPSTLGTGSPHQFHLGEAIFWSRKIRNCKK